MTALQWFAAAGLPLLIVVGAYGLMKLHQWDLRRHDRMHPGEYPPKSHQIVRFSPSPDHPGVMKIAYLRGNNRTISWERIDAVFRRYR
jgi:hypothetical protein